MGGARNGGWAEPVKLWELRAGPFTASDSALGTDEAPPAAKHKREVAAQASIPRSPTPSHTPRYMSYMSYILLLGVYKHTI